MGAIFGFVNGSRAVLNQDHLDGMGEVLRHRGPSHLRLTCDGRCGLGCRALPQEPCHGHELAADPDASLHLAVDGYLWNTDELRRMLPEEQRCPSAPLPLLLGNLYRQYGPDSCRMPFGPYTSALLDTRSRRLVLSRNVTGQRTLFYVQTPGFLAFASEIKALLRLPLVSRDMDEESLYWYLASGYVPQPATIYRDIRQLAPGAHLVCDLDGNGFRVAPRDVREGRVELDATAATDEEYVDELDRSLTAAVEQQAAALGEPIGCFLTGGVDTSLVLSILRKVTAKRIAAFVVGYDDPTCDETAHSRQTAAYFGVEHHAHRFGAADFVDLTRRIFTIHDEPFADLGAGTALLGAALARRHTEAVFTGAAADFLFGNFDLAYLYRYYRWLPSPARRALLAPFRLAYSTPLVARRFPNLQQYSFLAGDCFAEAFFTKWRKQELQALLRHTVPTEAGNFSRVFRQLQGLPLSDRILKSVYATYSVDCIDREFERSCMAHSLHPVNPYLSADVFRFANRLPVRLKYRRGYGKWVNRRLLRRYLPLHLFDHPKRGTSMPLGASVRDAMNALIDTYLDPARLRREGILQDLAPVQAAVAAYRAGRRTEAPKLWALIVLGMWREQLGSA
ncbi:MAG: hypothetical protein JXR77_13045 [Lentisphaeria bacterium]|nr:hypothetical protein [Lentisphaeria bacterium]